MIITRSWLNEWINIKEIETDDIAKKLNSIGLEVDRVEKFRVPSKVVFGRVLECEKHPDADKLNICKVDVGTGIRQIVCGAKNVRAGLDVVVATIGAELPNGMKIKHAVLRGVESEGMICSAGEIGLVEFGEGIIEVDNSIGSYEIGQDVNQNPYFNDDLIEIELTANRGDCLSIRGVARDLSAAFNKPLKKYTSKEYHEKKLGIGRIFAVEHKNNLGVDMLYRAVDIKEIDLPLLIQLRMAQIEEKKETNIETFLHYVTHSTGVILRGYDLDFFKTQDESIAKAKLTCENDFVVVKSDKGDASIVGVTQYKESKAKDDTEIVILEASYITPEEISKSMMHKKIESDYVYYRSSRGSEPDLEIGMEFLQILLKDFTKSEIFGGCIEFNDDINDEFISITKSDLDSFIGVSIDKTKITNILKNLGFNIQKSANDTFVLQVPKFRQDIKNKQDIVEEIVRLVGIDNIPSKPMVFTEANRLSNDYFLYKKQQHFRQRAAQSGFFEAVHFVFDDSNELTKYGFETTDEELELLNPIVNTLDTLRPTLMNWLLKSASSNKKNGYNVINLFELGSVFGTKREEKKYLGFIWSGFEQRDTLANNGKPKKVSFEFFVQKIADVIGDFELVPYKPSHKLANPYQSAQIVLNGKVVGEVFRVHPLVEKDFDLDTTFLCEIDFEQLSLELKTAQNISKFQASTRDLSLLVPKNILYKQIKELIDELNIEELVRFYPVDKYEDEKLGDNISLTIRFILQSDSKTLEEEDITSVMERILNSLNEKYSIGLR
ncbi:MAG: phenylalanine--tRNA ligase subunit beta [Epsilonproteobacteria bacterium]|nr:phenylalanine--tRNA ligase subunit beta [Campylobacterota bacterium]